MLWQRLKTLAVLGGAFIGLLSVGGVSRPCAAATIPYANQGPVAPGVSFINISESSGTDPVPLYGPPTAFATGLDFDPSSFVSSSGGGSTDITDGQVNFTIMGSGRGASSVGITSIGLFESGDYSLAGLGTNLAQALAGAVIQATVTQINGADVVPFNLTPANATTVFNLPPPALVQPWSLAFSMNVAAQMAVLGYSASQKATKIEVAIDNQLQTLTQTGTTAFIAKKDFRVNIGTDGSFIPEPTTLLLVLSGCLCAVAVSRRKAR